MPLPPGKLWIGPDYGTTCNQPYDDPDVEFVCDGRRMPHQGLGLVSVILAGPYHQLGGVTTRNLPLDGIPVL